MKIHIFYHIALIGKSYEPIISSTIDKLISSELYKRADSIHLGVLGDIDKLDFINYEKLSKFKIVYHSNDLEEFERPTLNYLWLHAQDNDAYYLYIHTKGVANPLWGHVKKSDIYARDWRNLLEYFTVLKWQNCVELLQDKDCVGINYKTHLGKHFSGNFWWSKSSYIRKLPKPVPECDRFVYEKWLFLNNPKKENLFSSRVNHYCNPYPDYLYNKESAIVRRTKAKS